LKPSEPKEVCFHNYSLLKDSLKCINYSAAYIVMVATELLGRMLDGGKRYK
jgi:hypothetical protein